MEVYLINALFSPREYAKQFIMQKVGQVHWFEEHLAFMIWRVTDNKVYFAYDNDFSKIEVIGNVCENADLLKEVEISE